MPLRPKYTALDDSLYDCFVAIRAFNDRVLADVRVESVMLAVADGLTLARKRGWGATPGSA